MNRQILPQPSLMFMCMCQCRSCAHVKEKSSLYSKIVGKDSWLSTGYGGTCLTWFSWGTLALLPQEQRQNPNCRYNTKPRKSSQIKLHLTKTKSLECLSSADRIVVSFFVLVAQTCFSLLGDAYSSWVLAVLFPECFSATWSCSVS